MIDIFNVLHRALSSWSSSPLPHLRCSFRLFSSGSIFSMKFDQFVVVWNWFVLKLFCFRFSLLKNDNKIRSNKKTLKFMHHSILLNKLAFTVRFNPRSIQAHLMEKRIITYEQEYNLIINNIWVYHVSILHKNMKREL